MLVDLSGRTALVTGGSEGLGLATALRFARSGANVVILARRPDRLERARAEIMAAAPGPVIRAHSCDVSDEAAVAATWDAITRQAGPVDILVNNAGGSLRRPIQDLANDLLHADVDLKVGAAVRLARLAMPAMRERHWGRIINVVSVAGKAPGPGGAPTAVSRAAGLALTKIMAAEAGPHNILVNALCVGLIESEQWPRFHQADRPDLSFEDYLRLRGSSIPLGRLGRAEEFANLACFLASDLASYVTGTAINVDGGLCPVL